MAKILTDQNFTDDVQAKFGTGGDMQILHDGSDGFINCDTGDLHISRPSGDNIKFITGSSFETLKLDGFGGVTTYSVLTTGGNIIVGGGTVQLNGTGRITGVDTVSANTDAANKSYVDLAVGSYVPLAGGTMTGVLSIPSLITHAGNTTTSFGFNANNQYDVIIAGQAKLRVNSTKIETFNSEITTSGNPQYFTYGGSGSQQLVFRENGPGGYKNSIIANAGGGIKLYYNNDVKLETVSGGITLGNNSLRLGQYSAIDLNGVGPSAGKVITGTGTSTQLVWNDSVANINVGAGLDVSSSTSNGATTKSIFLDFTELADTDGEDPGVTAFVVLDNEDENAKISLTDMSNVDTHFKRTQTILTSNFDDRSSSTSTFYMPLNYISETTSANYYNTFTCPTNGRIKRIRMMHTAGSTMSTFFTTELSILKNGAISSSSGELTPSNGSNDGSAIVWNPGSIVAAQFNTGDRLNFRYQKSGTGKYWYGVSVSIVVEFDNIF